MDTSPLTPNNKVEIISIRTEKRVICYAFGMSLFPAPE